MKLIELAFSLIILIKKTLIMFFYLFTWVSGSVCARAPRLISRPTEHPANPVSM